MFPLCFLYNHWKWKIDIVHKDKIQACIQLISKSVMNEGCLWSISLCIGLHGVYMYKIIITSLCASSAEAW